MASQHAVLLGRIRIWKPRFGSVFLLLLGVVCAFCVVNWMSSSYHEREASFIDYGSMWRQLVMGGLSGGELMVVMIIMVIKNTVYQVRYLSYVLYNNEKMPERFINVYV